VSRASQVADFNVGRKAASFALVSITLKIYWLAGSGEAKTDGAGRFLKELLVRFELNNPVITV
jgi:hypothetical protein